MADKQHNMNVKTGTVTITTPAANGTESVVLNGLSRMIEFTTANMQDTDSTNFVITSPFGGTFYASGTVAESTTYSNGTVFPLQGTMNVVAVGEGTQSASRTIPYAITYEE